MNEAEDTPLITLPQVFRLLDFFVAVFVVALIGAVVILAS